MSRGGGGRTANGSGTSRGGGTANTSNTAAGASVLTAAEQMIALAAVRPTAAAAAAASTTATDATAASKRSPCQCSYPNCNAPATLQPETCANGCGNPVHRLCLPDGVEQLFCHDCISPKQSSSSVTVATHQDPSTDDAATTHDNATPTEEAVTTARKTGGRPKGTTKAKQLQQKRARKVATNEVVAQYVAEKVRVEESAPPALRPANVPKKRGKRPGAPRVRDGLRKELVAAAIKDNEIEGKFDVSLQLINGRIKSGNLEVWHRGTPSPVLAVEVILNAFTITAWKLGSPLGKQDFIRLVNHMIEGTPVEHAVIAFKKQHSIYNPSKDLLGEGWYSGYASRNSEIIQPKRARKYANNRAEHNTHPNFDKMYKDRYHGFVQSGNAEWLDKPVHMDIEGNIVTDESLAFGRPVDMRYTRPQNVFFLDEKGCNTCETGDGANGGQLMMCPVGQTPLQVASTKDSHFTVVPVSNALGDLVLILIIFKGENLRPMDAMGVDIFADECEGGFLANCGPGKRYPGGPTCIYNGIEIPCLCAASPKSSMNGPILRSVFAKLDELGVTERGIDEQTGIEYWPASMVDGHFTRHSEECLEYLTDPNTKWEVGLGAIYGSDHWQLHDDERQNGAFDAAFTEAKTQRIRKKRLAGLKPEIDRHEIVILVSEASDKSFARKDKTKRALAVRGLNPPNRACLDRPQILETAPEEVKAERSRVLQTRQNLPKTVRVLPPPSQLNLLENGSGRLLSSGPNATSELLTATAEHLNLDTGRAGDIMNLAQNVSKRDETRARVVERSNTQLSPAELKKRLEEAKAISAGIIVSACNGRLCREVYEEVHRRNEYKKEHYSEQEKKRKKKLFDLKATVNKIRARFQDSNFKLKHLKVDELKTLCKYKKKKGDKGIHKLNKDKLIKRWEKTYNNPSPWVSPNNSFDEGLEEIESLPDSETSEFDNEAFLLGDDLEQDDEDDDDANASDDDEDDDDANASDDDEEENEEDEEESEGEAE